MAFDFFRNGKTPTNAKIELAQKASATGPVVSFHGAGRVAWSPRDTASLTRTGFVGNPVGFRCVKMIAEAAAALPLVLQDRMQRYEVHPLLALLKNPNQGQGRAEFFRRSMVSCC